MPDSWVRKIAAPLMPIGLLATLVILLVAQHHSTFRAASASVPPAESASSANVARYQLGVTTDPLARDAWRSWTASDLGTVSGFESAVSRHAAIVMWYADWQHNAFPLKQLNWVSERGSIPEITWEPWNAEDKTPHQSRFALREIIAGRFDRYLRSWARGFAAYGRPVRLRFAQEMNGFWYPWGRGVNGNRAGEFIRAWRHVHRIFSLAGAHKVIWVWSPVSGAPGAEFPGRGYVDALGLTCLNGGSRALRGDWRTINQICGRSVAQLENLAGGLPIELSETATSGNGRGKAQWITNLFAWLRAHSEVKTVIWFNLNKETNWMIQSSPAAERAMRAGLAGSRFK